MTSHPQHETSLELKNRERRRPDWQHNDRRQSRPWVADISDRRSGFDRRVEELRGERRS